LSSVHVYVENMDPCGAYLSHDYGAPIASDAFYKLAYNNSGAHNFTCSNGVPFQGYTFSYYQGTTQLLFNGVMTTNNGLAYAKTEVHNGSPITYNFIGCDPGLTCASSSYGLHVASSSLAWSLWDSSKSSTAIHYNPPFLHTFNNYWSFKTCPVSC